MSTLSLPISFPIVAGRTIDPVELNNYFHDPLNPEDSFSVINGYLELENMAPGLVIQREMTQRASAIEMFGASGTANLDFTDYWFAETEVGNDYTTLVRTHPNMPIPGAGITRPTKWVKTQALVMFTVFWTPVHFLVRLFGGIARVNDDDWKSAIMLTVDGQLVPSQIRFAGILGATEKTPDSYSKARVWSGHALIELEPGYHDIGLSILADYRIRVTRVHAVSIDAVFMCNDLTTLNT